MIKRNGDDENQLTLSLVELMREWRKLCRDCLRTHKYQQQINNKSKVKIGCLVQDLCVTLW